MHTICFTIILFHASTFFEHHVLIVRRSELYYTASGIITLKTSEWSKIAKITKITKIYKYYYMLIFIYFSNFRQLTCFSVMTPGAIKYNFDLLTMSTWCSKNVEAYNKLIVKQILCIRLVNY